MTILDDNDWKKLGKALQEMREITFTVNHQYCGVQVIAETERATPDWPVAILVGITVIQKNGIKSHQWFQSVEEAKRRTAKWRL